MRIVLLVLLLATAGVCRGETFASCRGFIESLPATITSGGTWCLDHDVATSMTSGAAIDIQSNNVTIDCNGFKVGGLGAGPATATTGILASGRLNVAIRECNLRGFRFGVALVAGGGHLVERNRVESSTLGGIFVTGPAVVRDNQVFGTANATSSVIGIGAGNAVDVVGNTISGVTSGLSGGFAYGVLLSGTTGSLVEDNTVRGLVANTGTVYGLFMATGSDRVLFRDNTLLAPDATPIGAGIFCQAGETNAVMYGNTVLGFPDTWGGCVDAGSNHTVLP